MAKQAAATADHGSGESGKSARSMSGKIKIAAIILAVVVVEWLVAYLYLPGSSSAAHSSEAEGAPSEVAHEDAHAAEHGGGHGGSHGKAAKETGHHGDQQEVDLGEFTVTAYQPVSNSTLFISFHLYGSVLNKHGEDFNRRLSDNKFRIRDNVIVIIRSAEIADLTDAGLGLIKRRILETTNKTLGKPLLQAVMFSDFSFVEQ
jgi:flagellar FliL protein